MLVWFFMKILLIKNNQIIACYSVENSVEEFKKKSWTNVEDILNYISVDRGEKSCFDKNTIKL